MFRHSIIAALALGAAACVQPFAGEAPSRDQIASEQRSPYSAAAGRGLAFAEQRCSACHAVSVNGVSPNPEAPPFEDIANRAEVTQPTLRQFLLDSHNYPAAMNFTVGEAEAGALAEYMVTLRKPGYRPIG